MSPSEGARAGGIALRATPFAAFPLLAIKGKETKKNQLLSTLIHSCRFKNQQPALGQYWIGRVAHYSIGADTVINDASSPANPTMQNKIARCGVAGLTHHTVPQNAVDSMRR